MFSFGAKYNKKKFDVDTTDLPYVSLETLYNGGPEGAYHGKEGEVFVIRGLYVNTKSRFGAAPLAVTDGAMVNFPRHLLDTVNEILVDPEAIDAINNGKAGFTVYQYQDNTYGRTCYGVNFCDVIPPRPPKVKKAAPANPTPDENGEVPF